jgi:hypothetical protein
VVCTLQQKRRAVPVRECRAGAAGTANFLATHLEEALVVILVLMMVGLCWLTADWNGAGSLLLFVACILIYCCGVTPRSPRH